jgi:predicted 3-demethylubiquinone-9 3-methyltransferase (glyoxalase superfamily)
MTVIFEPEGQEFMALNGWPEFKSNEAVSFVVNCETQKEVDEYWGKLLGGGKEIECGWLRDRYGRAWQVVATALEKLLQGKDP